MLVTLGDEAEEIASGFGKLGANGDELGDARKAREFASAGPGRTGACFEGETTNESRACLCCGLF